MFMFRLMLAVCLVMSAGQTVAQDPPVDNPIPPDIDLPPQQEVETETVSLTLTDVLLKAALSLVCLAFAAHRYSKIQGYQKDASDPKKYAANAKLGQAPTPTKEMVTVIGPLLWLAVCPWANQILGTTEWWAPWLGVFLGLLVFAFLGTYLFQVKKYPETISQAKEYRPKKRSRRPRKEPT
jgi:hypothetical protein